MLQDSLDGSRELGVTLVGSDRPGTTFYLRPPNWTHYRDLDLVPECLPRYVGYRRRLRSDCPAHGERLAPWWDLRGNVHGCTLGDIRTKISAVDWLLAVGVGMGHCLLGSWYLNLPPTRRASPVPRAELRVVWIRDVGIFQQDGVGRSFSVVTTTSSTCAARDRSRAFDVTRLFVGRPRPTRLVVLRRLAFRAHLGTTMTGLRLGAYGTAGGACVLLKGVTATGLRPTAPTAPYCHPIWTALLPGYVLNFTSPWGGDVWRSLAGRQLPSPVANIGDWSQTGPTKAPAQ